MIYSFFPNKEVAKLLHDKFIDRLYYSYVALLEEINSGTSEAKFDKLLQSFYNVNPSRYNGLHCFTYHSAINLLEDNETEKAMLLLSEVFGNKHYYDKYVYGTKISKYILDMIFTQCDYLDSNLNLSPTDDDIVPDLVEKLEQGMKIIGSSGDNLIDEISTTVKSILFFEDHGDADYQALSFTGDRMQTSIFINGSPDNNVVFIMDKLIHESAHTYLFLINLHEEMILNSCEKIYSSPLRSDKRDMIGIYHSTFVIQRLIFYFGNILLKSPYLTDLFYKQILELVAMYYTKLNQGYKTTNKYGNLTALSKYLLDEGQSAAMDMEPLLMR